MGRQLFRALVANGLFRSSAKAEETEPAPRRRMLLERLEDRLLFDAGPVAPVDVDAELAQAEAAAEAEAMPMDGSVLEPAEVRVIDTLDQIEESIADLLGQPLDGDQSLMLDPNETPRDESLLNSEEVARQLLTTTDEQNSELSAATSTLRRELAFVDVSVEDYETVVAGIRGHGDGLREIEVVLIDAGEDGVQKIADVLQATGQVDAVHILSHGSSGQLLLGSATLNFTSMETQYAEALRRIGQGLSADADILIYGCDFASGSYGQATARRLSEITGADVAASDDATGNAELGGDWILEQDYGAIESDLAVDSPTQNSWRYLLAQLDWDSVTWTGGSLSQSYSVGGGMVSLNITGDTARFQSGTPLIDTTNTGGLTPVEESLLLSVDYQAQAVIGDEAVNIAIGFSHPGGVSDVSFSIFDIDLSTWTDRIVVTGNNGAVINPSSVMVGSVVSFDGVNTVTGTASNSSTSANGNATFTFNQSGITQINIVYQSGRLADPTLQFISLHDINFTAAGTGQPKIDLDASSPAVTAGDDFSAGYNNNTGTIPWAGAWVENDPTDGTQSTTAGDVRIVAGQLSITGDNGGVGVSIARSIDLSAYTTNSLTRLSFDFSTESGVDPADALVVEISNNGGGSFTTLETFTNITGATSGTRSYSIDGLISATTQIRFRVSAGYSQSNEHFFVDNLVISAQPTGFSNTFTEDGAAVRIADTDTLITDPGVINLNRATITLTNPQTSDLLSVSGALPSGITLDPSSTSTLIVLTGASSLANYETAIEQLRFSNSSQSPNTTTRSITVVVRDNTGVNSNTATSTIAVVSVNDAPTTSNNSVTTPEDTPFTFSAASFPFSDVDTGNTLQSVRITSLPSVGSLTLGGVAVTVNQVIPTASLGTLVFTPALNGNGSPYTTFNFQVSD
ncbi:MAG: DUF4347 domain-containing protein, partial [Planctomycetaceae bacterium]